MSPLICSWFFLDVLPIRLRAHQRLSEDSLLASGRSFDGQTNSSRSGSTHRNSEAHMMIGDRLRDLREAKHLSQGDIEKRTGLLRCYVSRVEHGHAVPGIETLEKWAHGLQVPLYQFFYDEDEPPQVPTVLRSSKQKPNNDWASRGKGLRMFTKMRQALSRMRAEDRSLLMHMARKVSFGR